MDISIVVCTHNRARMLRDALCSLVALQTEDRFRFEIVVVDNASSDETPQVVADLQAISPATIRYVYEGKKGVAAARNRGVRESTGEWIAFFDDDQLADPAWLGNLHDYARHHGARAVGGPVHLKLPEGCTRQLHPFICMLLGESRLGSQPFAYSPKVSPGTGNLMLHRSVFDQIGLFDEQFAVRAEDTDLFCRMWKAGVKTWYVPNALVHHVTPHERLQESYLARLASFMGTGVAHREQGTFSKTRFIARFMAKAIVQPLQLAVPSAIALVTGHSETVLGLRMKRRLVSAYRQAGWKAVQQELKPYKAPCLAPKPQTTSRTS